MICFSRVAAAAICQTSGCRIYPLHCAYYGEELLCDISVFEKSKYIHGNSEDIIRLIGSTW